MMGTLVYSSLAPDTSSTPARLRRSSCSGKPMANRLPSSTPGTVRSSHSRPLTMGRCSFGGAAASCFLWWEQRPQPLPLLVGQVSFAHTTSLPILTRFENRP